MSAKIMIVDDEPAVGRLLHYQLADQGYEVVYVQDGLQALERVLLERPDLILLDVVMPFVSGWDVCRQVRAAVDVPVIMLTGKNADADVVEGLEAGADDYVTKPFSAAQLRARIEAVLRRSRGKGARARDGGRGAEGESRRARSDVWGDAAHAPRPEPRATRPVPDPGLSSPSPAPALPVSAAPAPPRLGQQMREARQRRGISLLQAERGCRVRWEFLQALEQENWGFVPQHQLRAALVSYVGYLGLDTHDIPERIGKPTSAPPLHLMAAFALLLALLLVGLTLL